MNRKQKRALDSLEKQQQSQAMVPPTHGAIEPLFAAEQAHLKKTGEDPAEWVACVLAAPYTTPQQLYPGEPGQGVVVWGAMIGMPLDFVRGAGVMEAARLVSADGTPQAIGKIFEACSRTVPPSMRMLIRKAALSEQVHAQVEQVRKTPAAVLIARQFHETYERLAPAFGYTTREESAVPWDEVPERNRKLMIAVVEHLLLVNEIALPEPTTKSDE